VHSYKRCAALTLCPPVRTNKGGAHHHFLRLCSIPQLCLPDLPMTYV
jgi:hypothetical protein